MTIFILLFLATLAAPVSFTSRPLPVVNNERLTHILTNFQVLAETSASESKQFFVRVLSVPDHGECGGSPASCPQAALFIAVSSIDEFPDQRLYELPKRHAWRFLRWTRIPDVDGPDQYVEFTLEADDPSPTPDQGWWRTTHYDVKVSYRNGRMSEHHAG